MFANSFGGRDCVECGLIQICPVDDWRTDKFPIPLQSVDVEASVVHSVAQVQITQVFVNKEEQPIEAVYYFPVDSNGAVTHFEAEVDGRKIKGVVKAHEEAKEQYEKAIEQKQTAFLGEENKADIFKVRIGYLKPGSQAKIIIGYVTEVKNEKDSNAIRFFVPTTVAPRYVPKNTTDEKAKDLKNMKFSETSPAPMTIKAHVSIQGAIKSIDSPTHKVSVSDLGPVPGKEQWTKATVELKGKTTDMDRDFVLLISPADPHKPRLYLEKLEKSLAVMAHLIPSFKLKEQNAELIFVLDRSGSMQGQSIQLAKKALTLFLHSLPDDCYFNIVGFGSSYECLFPKSVKYDDDSLKKAKQHATSLDADMGGTEILEPLKHIYNTEPIPGYLRQIFVLTDGEVGNTDEVLGLTKAKAHESRVFALGIGDGASHHLVEGIAKAGGGNSAFVTYNEPVDKKVLQQLKDALQPSLTNVQIKWHGVAALPAETPAALIPVTTEKTLMGYGKPMEAPAEKSSATETASTPPKKSYYQSPEKIPPIFDGSQLLVFGVFDNPNEKPTGCTITADSPDGPLTVDIQLSEESDVGSTGMLHKLASIKIVRDIELKVAALGFDYRDPEGGSGKPEEKIYKKEIIDIAVREGIASKYTSFIAVDTGSDDKTSDNWVMQTRMVPSQFAHGWHGGPVGVPMMALCSAPMPKSAGGGARFGCSLFGASRGMPPPPLACSSAFGYGSRAVPLPSTRSGSTNFGFGGQSVPPSNPPAGVSTFTFGSKSVPLPVLSNGPPSFGFGGPSAAIRNRSGGVRTSAFGSTSALPLDLSNGPSSFGSSARPPPPPPSGSTTFGCFGSASVAPASTGSLFGCTMRYAPTSPNFMAKSACLSMDSMECDDSGDASVDYSAPPSYIELEEPKYEPDTLEKILSYQSFNGSFKLEESLVKLLGLDLAKVTEEAKKNGWDNSAWATALALAYLSEKLQDRQESWELVAGKAKKWLSKNHASIEDAMTTAALNLVKAA